MKDWREGRDCLTAWVVGFGSEYRGDGAAGILLADRIYHFLSGEPGVRAVLSFEPFPVPPAGAEADRADLVVLCDADDAPRDEGFEISELPTDPRNPEEIHIYAYSAGAEWLLALKKRGTAAGKALLITVSGGSFDFSEQPMPACVKRIEDAEEKFRRLWRDIYCSE